MDLETLAQAPHCDANVARIDEAQLNYEKYKEEFEKLRNDVEVKLKFLEENRVSTLRKNCSHQIRISLPYLSSPLPGIRSQHHFSPCRSLQSHFFFADVFSFTE